MTVHFLRGVSVFGLALAGCAGMALAADEDSAPPPADTPDISWHTTGGLTYQFGKGLDEGGDMNVVRFNLGIGAKVNLDMDLDMLVNVNYGLDYYDFESASGYGAGGDPWDAVHTLTLTTMLTTDIANDWALFGGPIIKIAGEGGGDFDDSTSVGGFLGVSHRVSAALTVGAGLNVMTQIEDEPKFFPVILIDWTITDDIRLTSNAASSTAGYASIELIWSPDGAWEFGVGGGYHRSRFRLDDDGVAPDGVGEETGVPIWIRATYRMRDQLWISLYGGVMTDSDVELSDRDGDLLVGDSYNPAPFVGISARYRF